LEPKEFGKVDEATDQFQLGIIFYEMLTGIKPFVDEDKERTAHNIIEQEIDPPSYLNHSVPDELDELILKAVEKRKETRWGSTKLMYDELNKLVES
jgi:serine/threonine-protein kinase